MLFCGEIPSAFKSVIGELFRDEGLLYSVREEIEPAKLFFADFEKLEVDEDQKCIQKRRGKGVTMDCFRKNWLVNPRAPHSLLTNSNSHEGSGSGAIVLGGSTSQAGPRWRRCARCAAVMEDVLSQRQQLQWLVMQQRRCFCSGYWYDYPFNVEFPGCEV